MRDDFPADVVDLLGRRVGMRCSNPNCRQPTSGPRTESDKSINVGVAAHITAASPGGARYDSKMTAAARKSPDNGIWLCQTCSKLVDNDAKRYTVDLLRQWKEWSEEAARLAIESPGADVDTGFKDEDLVRFFAQCLDRPAFQDRFEQEGSMEAFDKAIEDTITAINTGCLRSRDGGVLANARGKAFLKKRDWRLRMDEIVDLLRAIRSRFDDAKRNKVIQEGQEQDGRKWYCVNDRALAEWMDKTREQVLLVFNDLCKEAGVEPFRPFPRRRP